MLSLRKLAAHPSFYWRLSHWDTSSSLETSSSGDLHTWRAPHPRRFPYLEIPSWGLPFPLKSPHLDAPPHEDSSLLKTPTLGAPPLAWLPILQFARAPILEELDVSVDGPCSPFLSRLWRAGSPGAVPPLVILCTGSRQPWLSLAILQA